MVGIRKAETLPNNITDDKIHYMLALPSASASAISTDFVRLLRPIYKPLSFAARVYRRRGLSHNCRATTMESHRQDQHHFNLPVKHMV